MTPHEIAVSRHYDGDGLNYELDRLERRSPVEMHMTLRALDRWTPRSGLAVEVGVGAGLYSVWLAARGLSIRLVDVSKKLLEVASARLTAAGFSASVLGCHHASATDLSFLPDACAEVVLLLGPLYHLPCPKDRCAAVAEAHRILRPGGGLFAAGVNRMAFLRDAFRESFHNGESIREVCRSVLSDGELTPEMARPIGHAHVTTALELEALFTAGFERVALLGLESFTSSAQDRLACLPEADRESWLAIVEATAALPDALGYADHILYVGRKR